MVEADQYGVRGQYLSILDPRPNLVEWREEPETLVTYGT